MTTPNQESHSFRNNGSVYERTQHSRAVLADVCLTDRATVREPEELAKRLFGVSRAITDIIHASDTEGRIVNVRTRITKPANSEILLGAIFRFMPSYTTTEEKFIAEPNVGYGALLTLHKRRISGVQGAWELVHKVAVPSDEDIINKLYSEPPVCHDMQDVYAVDTAHREEGTAYPFYSPDYKPGMTMNYLGVLQSLCNTLLRVTSPKA